MNAAPKTSPSPMTPNAAVIGSSALLGRCPVCGKAKPPRNGTCSVSCGRKMMWMHRTRTPIMKCEVCGSDFPRRGHGKRYCSRSCATQAKWINGNYKPERIVTADRDCELCGKTFRPSDGKAKYCSRSCSGKATLNTKTAFLSRHTPHERATLNCQHCGQVFTQRRAGRVDKFCSENCRAENITAAMRAKLTPAAKLKGKRRQAEEIAKNPKLRKGWENQAARIWRLRSPDGVVFEFRNLLHFIRENPNLFDPLDVQWVRRGKGTGMTCRAYGGLHSICPRHKIACGGWKGWTWWSQTERLNGGGDLLDRPNDKLTDSRP